MVLAVVDDHAHILHLVTRDGAVFEHLAHAFFDGWKILARNRAAFHGVDEFESAAARQRFDAQKHFAELACATGLFLVAMMAFRIDRDRFAIGDAWRSCFHFDAVALFHAFEHELQMQIG